MPFSKTLTVAGSSSTSVSSSVWIVDQWPNAQNIAVNCTMTGSNTYSLQGAYDDFSPKWDLVANPPGWVAITGFTGNTAAANGPIPGGPYSMLKLLVSSSTGTVTAKFIQSYGARAT